MVNQTDTGVVWTVTVARLLTDGRSLHGPFLEQRCRFELIVKMNQNRNTGLSNLTTDSEIAGLVIDSTHTFLIYTGEAARGWEQGRGRYHPTEER